MSDWRGAALCRPIPHPLAGITGASFGAAAASMPGFAMVTVRQRTKELKISNMVRTLGCLRLWDEESWWGQARRSNTDKLVRHVVRISSRAWEGGCISVEE